jgi:hypothetical protein
MPVVGSFLVTTHTTVGGAKSNRIGAGSNQPKHVIEIRNGSTVTYTVTVEGQVTGYPPKLKFGGNTTWTSPPIPVHGRLTVNPDHDITHVGPVGTEQLCCAALSAQNIHGSVSVPHGGLCALINTRVQVL